MKYDQLSKELFKDVSKIAVDCGCREVTIALSFDAATKTGKTLTVSTEQFVDIAKYLQKGAFIYIEDAHTRPRETSLEALNSSLAQPLTQEQWDSVKADCDKVGVVIISSPQKQAPKIRHFAGFTDKEKTDKNDAMSLLHYVENKLDRLGDPIWWRWKKFTGNWEISPRRAEGYAFKEEINAFCNVERAYKYFILGNLIRSGKADVKLTPISQWVWDNLDFLYENLSEETRLITRLSKVSKGKVVKYVYSQNDCKYGDKGDWHVEKINDTLLVSVACCLLNIHGDIRKRKITNDEGEVVREWIAGWNFIEEFIFARSPYHLNGGVGRSNECHHSKKPYIKEKGYQDGFEIFKQKKVKRAEIAGDAEESYKTHQKIHNKAVQELYHLMVYMIDPTIDNRTYIRNESEEMEVKESRQLELAFA